jgi:PAS domain S-box-containing protein
MLLAKLLPQVDGAPQRFYDVAFPLKNANGTTGVLGAHVSWEWAKDVRQVVFGGGRRGEVDPLIVSADGVVLLGPEGTEGKKLDLRSLREANAGRSGSVRERWPDGEEYVVGYSSTQGFLASPGLGWKVLVRQDTDAAFETLRVLQWRVFFGGIALAIVFSVLGWLGARQVTRPLLDLAGAARRLEQGDAQRVPISSAYREVEVLGTALNSLLANVQQKTDELHALNAQLEQRVQQRTAELQQAFDRVRANEQRIQTIIEAAQDPFIGVDLEGRVTDWSTQAEVVFGWTREDVIGRKLGETLLPARFSGVLQEALEAFHATGSAEILNRPIERVMVDRFGREFPVEVKIGLVNTGDQRFFAAFVHDISQRKEVERMKDEFISTVSHELRTPLTAIYGSLNLLTSGMAGELPPDAHQLLAISHDSTERLIRLINDMLDLEKIASGKIEYRMQQQPLRALVEQAVRDTRPYAENLGVEFRLVGDADARVLADADRIVQVCVNLLSNAAKFSPRGGSVEVEVRVEDGHACVGVTDHGAGVPPEFRDRMFQRFAQADASDRRTRGGTGLGLAICRSIVEAHGGEIGFTSEPDVRTEFYFRIPLAR